ncbi:hypothetical protein QWY85_00385 [Neolewinella lacunae]|uniref:Uncharacterized protein n=1 Tax=Neolewinella lacunae TaxID=1517758 RepID=A0A923TDZ9_9BACT|nr:hypothetical protein [Neolewinella lacunae]MBC6995382.1 hypothetical protein [Neolewinella lacunae]MDN3633094.1 hypothetical protein [Neolewinella lacunae]
MTVEARKKNIIDKIKKVKENWLLKSIEKLLSDVEIVEGAEPLEDSESNGDFSFYVGNIEENVDVQKIKEERPLKKLDVPAFEEMANALEWEESLEELLEDLR